MEPLKNSMNREVAELLADRFQTVTSDFDGLAFVEAVMRELPDLELKDRINLVAKQLRRYLEPDYVTALGHVVQVARSGVEGFAAWPLCSFVELFGVDFPTESLSAMEHLTQRMSCEFAIRPFLDQHLDQTVQQLELWTDHPQPTVRRLVSEGTRPRLPWGPRVAALTAEPGIGLGLIERLRFDESEDVRRSVANHLNDVAKDDPERVVELAERWKEDGVDSSMLSHALRSLVKKGDRGALGVLGFTIDAAVEVDLFEIVPPEIELGTTIELIARLRSTARVPQRLVVDYVVHHPSASGNTSTKVFKWKTVDVRAEETVDLTKRRRIVDQSTRTYHSGFHEVELQVAGETVARSGFDLTT